MRLQEVSQIKMPSRSKQLKEGKEESYHEDVSKIIAKVAAIFVEIKDSQIHHLLYFFLFLGK